MSESVNYEGKELQSIPSELYEAKNVSACILSNNALSEIDSWISKSTFPYLQMLDLSHNKLHRFGIDSTSFASFAPGLNVLDLSDNALSSLPSSIAGLGKLTTLILSQNKFSDFPTVISTLESLESLNMGFNQLTALPDSLGNLILLHTLIVDFNKIVTLPSGMRHCRALQKLKVNGTPLAKQTGRKVWDFNDLVAYLPEEVSKAVVSESDKDQDKDKDKPLFLQGLGSKASRPSFVDSPEVIALRAEVVQLQRECDKLRALSSTSGSASASLRSSQTGLNSAAVSLPPYLQWSPSVWEDGTLSLEESERLGDGGFSTILDRKSVV